MVIAILLGCPLFLCIYDGVVGTFAVRTVSGATNWVVGVLREVLIIGSIAWWSSLFRVIMPLGSRGCCNSFACLRVHACLYVT